MRSLKHLGGTARALHRVFVASTEPCRLQRALLPLQAGLLFQRCLPLPYVSSIRPYASQISFRSSRSEKPRAPRDEEIKATYIKLADGTGKLQEGLLLTSVLAGLDREKEWLVQVAESTDGNPEAICRIVKKATLREGERQRAKSARATARSNKTLELNWAIDPHDLEHRLGRLQDFLEKGMRVEITVAPKRKGRKATLAEALALMGRIRETAATVDRAKEMKEPEGRALGLMTMIFDGRGKPVKV